MCVPCVKGRFETHAGFVGVACSGVCPSGRYGDRTGLTSALECFKCSTSRYSTRLGATSKTECRECTVGRFSSESGRSSDCTETIGGKCPVLTLTGIEVASKGSLLNQTPSTSTTDFTFGDQLVLRCLDGTNPTRGPSIVSCTSIGTWVPDPTSKTDPTLCEEQFCETVKELPPASNVKVLTPPSQVKAGELLLSLKGMVAPTTVAIQCVGSARMISSGLIRDKDFNVIATCTVNGTNALKWLNTSEDEFDFDSIKCQCEQGFKQGSGDLASECIQCLDGTYAPINIKRERDECRSCPREGVSCNDGILQIYPDFWYDASRVTIPDKEGRLGVGTSTTMYACAMRDACLVNKTKVPMTVACHENHTGVMCARCFSRRVDCGRQGSGETEADCPAPGFFDREPEWMYFAPIARHCMRCPAGDDAIVSYIVTIALLITFCAALVLVVVNRLASAWKRVKGKTRSDASGIARVFFNWIQMVSMLQSIKLQPPEEVTNAMETAEVMNVSVEWFPVQCTLRLTFFHRVLIYALMPIFAVLIPLIYVHIVSKCTPFFRDQLARKRRTQRTGKKIKGCVKCFYSVVGLLAGDDLVKKAASRSEKEALQTRGRIGNDKEALHHEIDTLLDELWEAEEKIEELEAAAQALRSNSDTPTIESAMEGGAPPSFGALPSEGSEETAAPSAFDDAPSGAGSLELRIGPAFYEVISSRPISLRERAALDAPKVPWLVSPGDILRSARVVEPPLAGTDEGAATRAPTFIELTGAWGSGWIFDSLPDGTQLLREIECDAMADASAEEVEPHYRDELRHCFDSICAMTPQLAGVDAMIAPDAIARASIEHVLPSAMTPAEHDAFFASYDADGDGTIDFSEFVAMYPALRKEWRFESVWAEFQHLDKSGDGKLQIEEVRSLVPQGSSAKEIELWMRRYDCGAKGYITLSDFVAIDHAVQRDMLLLSIGTAFVMCTYFVYSRVTKALLSVFSMEKIEGELYLKLEMGTPALTNEHIGMMVIAVVYLSIFSICVPIVGLYLMFYQRHSHGERRFTTIAGFLMDGYRQEVSWFWEFVVLLRKLVILGVSLFIWEPFMQSFAAVVVLIISLSIQLYFQPFELAALNLLEIGSLTSLLMTQLGGVLMWYKQLPGRNDNLEMYRRGATVMLFATNGIVIASFVGVTLWYYLKQKSKMIVQWLPFTQPLFERIVYVEEELRWPNGTELLASERLDIREDWSFFASLREGQLHGRGAAHSARKRVKKMAKNVAAAAGKVGKKLKIGDTVTVVEGDGLLGSGAVVIPRLEGGPGDGAADRRDSIDVGRVRSLNLGVNSKVNPLGVLDDGGEQGRGESAPPARLVL